MGDGIQDLLQADSYGCRRPKNLLDKRAEGRRACPGTFFQLVCFALLSFFFEVIYELNN